MGANRCDEPCLSSLVSIDRVADVLDKYGPKRRKEALRVHNKHLKRFTNRNNGSYPVVNERVRRKGKTDIVNRVHPNPVFRNKGLEEMRAHIDRMCPDGVRCTHDGPPTFHLCRRPTNTPFLLGECRWFSRTDTCAVCSKRHCITAMPMTCVPYKRGTVVRATDNTVDISTMLLCYAIYASWVVLAFVYPGTLLTQAAHVQSAHRTPHSAHVWLLVGLLLVPYTHLVYRHLDAVRNKTDDNLIEITTLLVQARLLIIGDGGSRACPRACLSSTPVPTNASTSFPLCFCRYSTRYLRCWTFTPGTPALPSKRATTHETRSSSRRCGASCGCSCCSCIIQRSRRRRRGGREGRANYIHAADGPSHGTGATCDVRQAK